MAKKSQIQKFREAAREAGADESAARFDATLKELGKRKRDPKAREDAGSVPSKDDE